MKNLKYKDSEGNWNDLYQIHKPTPDPFNGYDYVDMGEAGIWATCNVGASKPEDWGLYFQWGDTKGYKGTCSESQSDNSEDKHYFGWSKYKFGIKDNLTKYNETDGLTTLELEDDAAHVNMGGNWRMPTKDEFEKLYDLCNKEWTDNYEGTGVKGRIFKLKTDESKQVFFPAAGYCLDGLVLDVGSNGYVWSSLLYSSNVNSGYYLYFINGSVSPRGNCNRYYGFSIRGFIPKSN